MSDQDKAIKELIERTRKELEEAKKPHATSRSWKSPQGYKFLFPWSNAVLLRILIRKLTETLPRSEYRSKAQVDDATRSVVANIEEGYKRSTTGEYIRFLGFSQGSLEEVKGDIERLMQDGFLKSVPESKLTDFGIDLKLWNLWARNPLNSSRILYFPLKFSKGIYRNLKDIKGDNLTYEVFMELINKTDWLLRRLVRSLEQKQDDLKLCLAALK